MTLHDVIEAFNTTLFNTDEFAESVSYWPLGVEANAFTINAVVDWNTEEGNNQVQGDGRSNLNADKGRHIRSSAIVELPRTRIDSTGAEVPLRVNESGKDRIAITEHSQTVMLNVKRVVGHDEGSQSVLCVFPREVRANTKGRIG